MEENFIFAIIEEDLDGNTKEIYGETIMDLRDFNLNICGEPQIDGTEKIRISKMWKNIVERRYENSKHSFVGCDTQMNKYHVNINSHMINNIFGKTVRNRIYYAISINITIQNCVIKRVNYDYVRKFDDFQYFNGSSVLQTQLLSAPTSRLLFVRKSEGKKEEVVMNLRLDSRKIYEFTQKFIKNNDDMILRVTDETMRNKPIQKKLDLGDNDILDLIVISPKYQGLYRDVLRFGEEIRIICWNGDFPELSYISRE